MTIFTTVLAAMALMRFLYVLYVTYVEKRELQADDRGDVHQDLWMMMPAIGDIILICGAPWLAASLINKWLLSLGTRKKASKKELEAKITRLEERVRNSKSESKAKADKALEAAVREVESYLSKT
jgi:hypothetical protein